MGRRSSTKSGKSVNPTDQARKEARKRELKKNKKQRQIVREAVLKNRDPRTLLTEMEAIDKMEYDPNNPPPYNVKVLQEKRNKLRATWNRMLRLYEKDDVKQFNELKHLEIEYENRRVQMMTIYESIKQAEKVNIDEIPLPESMVPPPPPPSGPTSSQAATHLPPSSDIPLPAAPTKSILKPKPEVAVKKKPPGPPAGIPPSLIEFEVDEEEEKAQKKAALVAEDKKDKSKKIRFLDEDASSAPIVPPTSHFPPFAPPGAAHALRAPMAFPPPPPPQAPAQTRPLMTPSAFPPGPPPPSLMPQYGRMQAAPPPPPPASQVRYMAPSGAGASAAAQNTFSAPPTRSAPQSSVSMSESTTTIEAKPVLRNKMAELTRFVPSSVIVRREQKPRQANKADPFLAYLPQQSTSNLPAYTPKQAQPVRQEQQKQAKPSTDAAYEAFMKEMSKIL